MPSLPFGGRAARRRCAAAVSRDAAPSSIGAPVDARGSGRLAAACAAGPPFSSCSTVIVRRAASSCLRRHHLVDEADRRASRRRTARRSGNSAAPGARRSRAARRARSPRGSGRAAPRTGRSCALLGRDRDVAAGDEADAAAEGRALHHARPSAWGSDRCAAHQARRAPARRARFSASAVAPPCASSSRGRRRRRSSCPLPRSTTTRTAASLAELARTPAVSSAIRRSSKALCSSGRFSVSRRDARRAFVDRCRDVRLMRSHPEHAEARRLDRRVERGRQAQRRASCACRRDR